MSPHDTGSCPPDLYFLMSLRHCLWTAVESEETVAMSTVRAHLPQPNSEALGSVVTGMAGSGTSLVGCCFLGLELPGVLEGFSEPCLICSSQ